MRLTLLENQLVKYIRFIESSLTSGGKAWGSLNRPEVGVFPLSFPHTTLVQRQKSASLYLRYYTRSSGMSYFF